MLIVKNYLLQIDDGWVMRNVLIGGTARGYLQAEDEALFDRGLLLQLLNNRVEAFRRRLSGDAGQSANYNWKGRALL